MRCFHILAIIVPLICFESPAMEEPPEPAELCDSLHASGAAISLRGLGRVTDSGVLLSDATCPAAERKGAIVPAAVRVYVVSFAREEDKKWVTRLRDRIERPFVQVVVRGILTCNSNLKVAYDKEDDNAAHAISKTEIEPARTGSIWEGQKHATAMIEPDKKRSDAA